MMTAIHEQLRTSREAMGLSIADVAHETRIPATRIKLIEEGKFAAIGSMAYARNFLLTYSRYLGVDVSDTLDSLPRPIFAATESYGYLRKPVCSWVSEEKKGLSAISAPTIRKRRAPTSPLAKAIALVFFVGILATWWASKITKSNTLAGVTQAQAVSEPVAMTAATTINVQTTKPSELATAIPWEKVNRAAVRRAEIVPDDVVPEVPKPSVASANQEGLKSSLP